MAAAGALLRLPRRIPYHVAMELALTGEPIGAVRARRARHRLAARGVRGSAGGAHELAELIARNGPLAIDATKRIVAAAADWPADEAWERQGEIAGPVFTSEDAREGATAFAEKRDPVWRGALSLAEAASRPATARRRGRGARTGRCPATCRARSGRG